MPVTHGTVKGGHNPRNESVGANLSQKPSETRLSGDCSTTLLYLYQECFHLLSINHQIYYKWPPAWRERRESLTWDVSNRLSVQAKNMCWLKFIQLFKYHIYQTNFHFDVKSVESDNENKKSIVQESPQATLADHAKTVRDWFLLKLWDVTDMQITGKRTLMKNSISGLFKF